MSKLRWIVPCLALLGFGCGSDITTTHPNGDTLTAPLPTEVTEALATLDAPSPTRIHFNEPPFPTKTYQPHDYYEDCADAIDLLTQTASAVDASLLAIARSDKPLPARYRAASILIQRRNREVIPVLDRMCSADGDLERYVAWWAYRKGIESKHIPAPSDFTAALALYEKERDREVREQITDFLGSARARAAVPVLIEALRSSPGDYSAIWALGEIGDPRAVPAVIAAFEKANSNRHINCHALGRLATAEAVEFLMAHLDQYGAVEALAETKNPKALPALTAHLAKLTRSKESDDLHLALAKVAVTQLSHKDPAPHLLALGEDRGNSEWLRRHALGAMREYPAVPLHPRLLRLFRDDADLDVKRCCVDLLADSSLGGVTEALVERALALDDSGNLPSYALRQSLLEALNKRLGYSCRTFAALEERLRNRPANVSGN